MRIEPAHVRAVVYKLNEWGYRFDGSDIEDLIAEFDTKIDGNLQGGGKFRRNDPDTSKIAAMMKQDDSRAQVLLAFAKHTIYGLTNDELYRKVDPDGRRDRDSWVPRVGELKRMGFVETTPAKRKGSKRVLQQVNSITPKGIAFVRQKGWM